jgi:transcriptional regulator NrdR family protein
MNIEYDIRVEVNCAYCTKQNTCIINRFQPEQSQIVKCKHCDKRFITDFMMKVVYVTHQLKGQEQ